MKRAKVCAEVSDALSSIPLVVELKGRWNDIRLEENHIPKHEFPEICLQDHVIGIPDRNISYDFRSDGQARRCEVLAGESLIIPSQQAFVMTVHRAHVSKALHLPHRLLARNALELWETDDFELLQKHQVKDPLMEGIQAALRQELKVNSDDCAIYAQTMANALAVQLLVHHSAHSKPIKIHAGGLSSKHRKLVVEFIHGHLDHHLGLDELASLVALSQYHFARAFKQSFGVSPHQYVIKKRIELSKALLSNKEATIHDVALDCGFSSPSHFAKCFRAHMGMTPKQFRDH